MIQQICGLLTDEARTLFMDIEEQRVLGASNHISMIGRIIELVAEQGDRDGLPTEQIVDTIRKVTDYFIKTRGEASQAVVNAIRLMTLGLDDCLALERDAAIMQIKNAKSNYLAASAKAISQVVTYGVSLAKDMDTIFVYDYSSTVERFLRELTSNGKRYLVYIAESRIINGGKPFVKPCIETGLQIKFIPDAAMMYYLKDCDAAFMGAETFYPDGTGFNTTGSDIVGLVCDHYRIPLYFLTPMIKLDMRPVQGGRKNIVFNDQCERLTAVLDKGDYSELDFKVPELLGVPPQHIKAFVTERGVIPAGQMYGPSLEYSRELCKNS